MDNLSVVPSLSVPLKLLDYNAKVHPEGEGLPIEQQHAAARVRAPCGAVWRYVALCGDMGIVLRYVNNGIRLTQSCTGHWHPPVAGARPEAACGFSCT